MGSVGGGGGSGWGFATFVLHLLRLDLVDFRLASSPEVPWRPRPPGGRPERTLPPRSCGRRPRSSRGEELLGQARVA